MPLHFPVKDLDIAWLRPSSRPGLERHPGSDLPIRSTRIEALTLARIWATPKMQHTTTLAARCGERRIPLLLDIQACPQDRKKHPLPRPSEGQETITQRREEGGVPAGPKAQLRLADSSVHDVEGVPQRLVQ